MSVYIIAEAGVNHNGNLENALKLVDIAKQSGANCVKFQTFISDNMCSKFAEKAKYQISENQETQLEMIKKLELSFDDFITIKNYCNKVGISFCSTPFDLESIDFLSGLNMPFWKIPSGEITNLPYLIKIGKLKQKVILSTGMCTINEIDDAIKVLNNNGTFDISLLHCTTEYPAPFVDVNLKAINNLKETFNLPVGYSDHTLGIEISIGAVALGATIIEKHFTLDVNMEGPDHKSSLNPTQLKQMVMAINNVSLALGDGKKQVTKCEEKNITIARKSIVAKTSLKKGSTFTEHNVTTKRPGNGISPMKWFDVIGKEAIRDFEEDELIEL